MEVEYQAVFDSFFLLCFLFLVPPLSCLSFFSLALALSLSLSLFFLFLFVSVVSWFVRARVRACRVIAVVP